MTTNSSEDRTTEPTPSTPAQWRQFWSKANYTIYQWDNLGSLVSTWSALGPIVDSIGGDQESLLQHIQGRRSSYLKYRFTLSKEAPGAYEEERGAYLARGVRLTDVKTGQITEFKSISEAERQLGLAKSSLQRAYKTRGKTRQYYIEIL